jgi:murein DD-endopeptidase MepM/ murein hydrolase activator NlpD
LNKYLGCLLLLSLLMISVSSVQAQDSDSALPVYVVQAGDTLWTIARKLHVSYDALLAENDLNESSSIIPGTQLQIPGLDGFSGVLSTVVVPYGESLASLSRRYQMSEADLIKLNRLTNPFELYVGVSAVVISQDNNIDPIGERTSLAPEQSTLELAVLEGLNPWILLTANAQKGESDLLPGEVVVIPGTEPDGPGALPESISKVLYSPESFIQGHTYTIKLKGSEVNFLTGYLGDEILYFFTENETAYHALQGIDGRETPGIIPLSISGELSDGTPFAHTQMVRVFSGEYPFEPDISPVPPNTVGVGITEEETLLLKEIADQATTQKYWNGEFISPVPPELSQAYASYYGGRRSYNGSGYFYYHTGLDYYSQTGVSIYAVASGRVVYTNSLLLHGNTTMIDHGWGVYTLYAHQSEILVQEGQQVAAGDMIGRVGTTGRSTGSHMHLEVWVGGIQVDPLEWLRNEYP